jgi:NADPH-dependent F420 reductase
MNVIGVVGGTGPQGRGLAYRFAKAGRRVVLGSRDPERAWQTAQAVLERVPNAKVSAADNADTCRQADVVVLAVPFLGHAELIESIEPLIRNKVVVSCINPLGFDRHGPFGLDVQDGSAAEEAQRIAPSAFVVGAFHHLSASNLWGDAQLLSHEDVLVCGENAAAKMAVADLARSITGRPGIDAGGIRLARQLEPLTAVLISVNKRHRVKSGIRIAGLAPAS